MQYCWGSSINDVASLLKGGGGRPKGDLKQQGEGVSFSEADVVPESTYYRVRQSLNLANISYVELLKTMDKA